MTSKLQLPAELVGLPEPWGTTDDFKRAEAADELQLVPETFDIGLETLERALQALTRLPDPETLALPDEIGDAYAFVFHEFAKQIPTLDEFTEDPIEQYLLSLIGRQPDEATTRNLASAWIHSVSAGMSRTILRWLSKNWRQFPQDRRSRLLDIAQLVWAKLPDELVFTLLATVSSVAQKDSIVLLAHVQEHGATPELRRFAAKQREYAASK